MDKRQQIAACQGIYRAADVARAYDVHRSTVTRIWARAAVVNQEPPNIQTRPRPSELQEDIRLLLNRGMTVKEVADALGISERSVYQYRGVWV